jgi:hypothetical protein
VNVLLEDLEGPTPAEHQTGYGPRLCAKFAEISAIQGNSRETVKSLAHCDIGFRLGQLTLVACVRMRITGRHVLKLIRM